MISANYKGKTSSDEDDEQGSRSVQTQSLSFSVDALMSKKGRKESTSHEPIQMPFIINAEDRSVDFPKHRESVEEDSSWINTPTLSPRKLPYSLLFGRFNNNDQCLNDVIQY